MKPNDYLNKNDEVFVIGEKSVVALFWIIVVFIGSTISFIYIVCSSLSAVFTNLDILQNLFYQLDTVSNNPILIIIATIITVISTYSLIGYFCDNIIITKNKVIIKRMTGTHEIIDTKDIDSVDIKKTKYWTIAVRANDNISTVTYLTEDSAVELETKIKELIKAKFY